MSWSSDLIQACHQIGGFDLAGIVDIESQLQDPDSIFQQSVRHYDAWLSQGHAGEMEYLKRGRDRRANPKLVFPEVKSVLSVVLRYPSAPLGSVNPEEGVRYARYLRGGDYHTVIADQLESVLQSIATHDLKWKICVDTSAVLERTWAYLCGLGWIGKNTLLIHPKLGSYLLLGTVFLNQESGQPVQPLPDFCGNCSRCLEGCPTKAFVKPHELDSTKCISYLTLEKRGEFSIEEKQLKRMGNWVAGCDICQEVCPFNLKISKTDLLPAEQSFPDTWVDLTAESHEDYRARIKKTALSRIKPAEFKRNLKQAHLNSRSFEVQKI